VAARLRVKKLAFQVCGFVKMIKAKQTKFFYETAKEGNSKSKVFAGFLQQTLIYRKFPFLQLECLGVKSITEFFLPCSASYVSPVPPTTGCRRF
jgi:hypothetical protein